MLFLFSTDLPKNEVAADELKTPLSTMRVRPLLKTKENGYDDTSSCMLSNWARVQVTAKH